MTTLREKVRPRVNALWEIAKNLIELAWLFFAAAQWFAGISIPCLLAAAIIFPFIGKPLPMTVSGITLMSFSGHLYTYILLLIYASFAYYYLLKIRKQEEPAFARKCTIMALYLSVMLMLSYKIQLCEHRYVLDKVQYSETTVRLFDAVTRKPLTEGSYIGPPSGGHSVWPTKYITTFAPDGSFTIQLIDIEPVEVGFTAPGYETQYIQVGQQEGDQTISVLLNKKTTADPNMPGL